MILIGQYDSPFVRRVAIALSLYGLAYEHRPWSVYGDAEKVRTYNPMMRVPTLVLDDGEVLIESNAILDHLDEVAGAAKALIARGGRARREALKVAALATGLAEKSLSMLYERVLHQEQSDLWLKRCTGQIGGVCTALEADRIRRATAYWFGDAIGHADIAVACALRFTREAHPGIFDEQRWPALARHAATCEARPEFQRIQQTLKPPSSS